MRVFLILVNLLVLSFVGRADLLSYTIDAIKDTASKASPQGGRGGSEVRTPLVQNLGFNKSQNDTNNLLNYELMTSLDIGVGYNFPFYQLNQWYVTEWDLFAYFGSTNWFSL